MMSAASTAMMDTLRQAAKQALAAKQAAERRPSAELSPGPVRWVGAC